MSRELTISGSLAYADSDSADLSLAVTNLIVNVTTKVYAKYKQSIGFAAAEALILGEVVTPTWIIVVNRDATNYVNLTVATGGAIFAHLLAGWFAILPLGSGAQAPFAQANTAACLVEVLLCSL